MTEAEFTAKQAELLAELPEEFRGAVSFYAWQEGHASGYHEVLSIITELVDMLGKPIAAYTARIKQS